MNLTGCMPHFFEAAQRRISEWNERHPEKSRDQIPAFVLREIRGSVALEHYLASGGDIRRAQQALNHRQSQTTTGYIEGPATKDKNAQILAEVQRQIVQLATHAYCDAQPSPSTAQHHRKAPPKPRQLRSVTSAALRTMRVESYAVTFNSVSTAPGS